MRRRTSGATAAHNVKIAPRSFPERMLARTPAGSLGREVRDEVSPFSIGGVGRIVLALHGQGAVELPGYGLPEASAPRIRPSAASTPSDATPAATKKASL